MNTKKFSEAMSEIDDKYYVEATNYQSNRKKQSWIKWGAIAACLCLIVAAFPVANILHNKGNQSGDAVQTIAALEYNGCYYEACDIDWVLEKFGLPNNITAAMAGEHLSYLVPDGAGYKETAAQSDIELYEYAPFPCRSVYVLRDGESYMAALFCNFKRFDTNTNYELPTLYQLYGIEGAEDIASISHVDWNKGEIIGNIVTNADLITEFYSITAALISCGNDDFQAAVFGEILEEEQPAAHTAFADDNTTICIEATSGLRFFIQVYPSYGWIESGGAMSYYQMNEAMHQWFNNYIE